MEFIVFVLSACIGSFINVVAYSLPRKMDFVFRRSRCDHCLHQLSFFDMIPIVSFIFLKGKCRYCHSFISLRDSIVELICGFIGVILYDKFGQVIFLIAYLFFIILVLSSLIDIDTMIVYDELLVLLFITGLFFMNIFSLTFVDRISGMFILSAPMYMFNLYKESFGGGDIKLFTILGFLFGTEGVLCIFIYASFLTSLYALVGFVFKKVKVDGYIPFVPFISVGSLIFVLFENLFV